jgi:hypothetical protein
MAVAASVRGRRARARRQTARARPTRTRARGHISHVRQALHRRCGEENGFLFVGRKRQDGGAPRRQVFRPWPVRRPPTAETARKDARRAEAASRVVQLPASSARLKPRRNREGASEQPGS